MGCHHVVEAFTAGRPPIRQEIDVPTGGTAGVVLHVAPLSVDAIGYDALAGVPPLTYLRQWRMRLAEHALRTLETSIAALAPSLGYRSESAFSHAFKRTIGVAPHRYRHAARASRSSTDRVTPSS